MFAPQRALRPTPQRARGAFTGSLYQLFSGRQLNVGEYVEVNGPWDTYGAIVKSEAHADGRFLNLIRGVKPRAGETPVASF